MNDIPVVAGYIYSAYRLVSIVPYPTTVFKDVCFAIKGGSVQVDTVSFSDPGAIQRATRRIRPKDGYS